MIFGKIIIIIKPILSYNIVHHISMRNHDKRDKINHAGVLRWITSEAVTQRRGKR